MRGAIEAGDGDAAATASRRADGLLTARLLLGARDRRTRESRLGRAVKARRVSDTFWRMFLFDEICANAPLASRVI